ncbi:hypothetical protein CHU98_g10419 [Xylaria longipes]|nr:hypothetical protein CHU98_g10419 [Xylaria longipes]
MIRGWFVCPEFAEEDRLKSYAKAPFSVLRPAIEGPEFMAQHCHYVLRNICALYKPLELMLFEAQFNKAWKDLPGLRIIRRIVYKNESTSVGVGENRVLMSSHAFAVRAGTS